MDDYYIKMAQHQQSKEDLANAQKINKDREDAYQKEWIAYKKDYQSYQENMEKYHKYLASMPSKVVTLDKATRLLVNNPFTVTVTPKLQGGVAAVVYQHDRIKNGFGEIYIEDKRGRGEHSRTICINMLGNFKVVKGNQSCP